MALETLEAPRDQVAAGVELAAAGFERVAVHLQRAALLDAQAGGAHEIQVHGLAHRQDHGVAVEAADLFGGDRPAAAGCIELAQPGLYHLDGFDVALFVAHDAVRRRQEDEFRAFVLGRVGLLPDGRHVFALAAVDHRHVGAHAERGARRVDGGVAAADHHHLPAQPYRLALGHGFQEEQGGNHALQLRPGQIDPGLFPGADGEEDGVVLVVQIVQRNIGAHRRAADEVHAHAADQFDFAAHDFSRQAVLGQRVAQHAAGLGVGVVDRDFVPEQGQVERRGEPVGPAAHHRHFAVRRRQFAAAMRRSQRVEAVRIVDRSRR